jgi:hypothetical protein
MKPQKLAHARFFFPQLENTPEYRPEILTPASSHTSLLELSYMVEISDPETDRKSGDIEFLGEEPLQSHISRLLQRSKALISIYGPYTT